MAEPKTDGLTANQVARLKESQDSQEYALVQYLQAWWNAGDSEASSSDQPAPMTYDEVMQLAPRRRLNGYADALDDASSSGDEGDLDLDTTEVDDDEAKRQDISKVIALHQDLIVGKDSGVAEAKTLPAPIVDLTSEQNRPYT